MVSIDDIDILTTKSVNSPVFGNSDIEPPEVYDPERGDKEVFNLDHVLLLDFDGKPFHAIKDRFENYPGITLCFESSEGSFHVWNLTVRPRLEVLESMVLLRDDPSHIRNGLQRAYWRLRIGPKVRESQDIYKERPGLKTIWINETDSPQSKAHWNLAKALWDLPDLPVGFDWIEGSIGIDGYYTITDMLKERWSDD